MLHSLLCRRLIHRTDRFHRKCCSRGSLLDCLVGFCKATCAGFSVLARLDSLRSFFVFFEIAGAVFAVITWTTSLVASSLRLSPPNEDGAKPWARAPALKVTETNAVASAKKIRSPRTRARYAGNHKSWQAFFSVKTIGNRPLDRYQISACAGIMPLLAASIARQIIRLKAGRRTEHLAAVHVNPVSMTRLRLIFVRRHDRGASRWKAQDQSPVGCDTRDATANRTNAPLLRVCGSIPTGACAVGFRCNRFRCALSTPPPAGGSRWRFGVCLS